MSDREFVAGNEVDSICGKCKAVRSHVIIAVVDGGPKRVECLTCHAVHNYRSPERARKPASTAGKPSRPRTTSGILDSATEDKIVDYSPGSRYEEDMVLRHGKFGLGVISRVTPTRLTVAFRDKTRVLVATP